MEKSGLFFVRFIDDIVALAPSRWKPRRAVKAVKEVLGGLRLEKHPDKTFIGRIERGFDFLGYQFARTGLTVAKDREVRRTCGPASRAGPEGAMQPLPVWAVNGIKHRLQISETAASGGI